MQAKYSVYCTSSGIDRYESGSFLPCPPDSRVGLATLIAAVISSLNSQKQIADNKPEGFRVEVCRNLRIARSWQGWAGLGRARQGWVN